MNTTLIRRLSLDLIMTALILLEFAYRLTGSTVHELIGLSMFTLFAIHGAWNWRWFVSLLNGKYGGIRVMSVTINVLLVATALLMILSGLFNSDLLFSLVHVEFELLPRELHTAAAYWFLILMAVHLGMHWKMAMVEARKLAGISFPSRLRAASLQAVSAIIAAYGIFASFERSIFSRLTAYYSFGNWEFDESVLGFFVQYASIVGLYAYLAHQALQLFKNRSRSNRHAHPGAYSMTSMTSSWWCKCKSGSRG